MSWPRVSFRLRELFPNSGFNSRCRETVPNYFPISENGFRCRGTVSDIGKWSGNSSDIGKRFPMSENSYFTVSGNCFQCRKSVSGVG